MDIQQATQQIEGAIKAYLSTDSHGLLRIPFHMQRPIIMFGPPGVGKTAIVSQIAQRMDINFVSYSITHHTRQSALGLPYITQQEFDGKPYSVSDYTMSEIIAAVYRAQEESGVKAGILFLDEVNCVSETLAPAMLQFLQYKTFGMHRLPEGWVIVCAGNPPEYNRAARDFDPAMLDRLKRIDVEPNLQVWQDYAAAHGVHPAVTTFLEAKPASFYKVQASVSGTRLVTARGWEDLSRMLQAYEAEGIAADAQLVGQYLQDEETAREFFAYYQLFRKYQDDYKVTAILDGEDASAVVPRARESRFDERIALVGLLLDALLARVHDAIELEEAVRMTRDDLLSLKPKLQTGAGAQAVTARIDTARRASSVGSKVEGQVGDTAVIKAERLRLLEQVRAAVTSADAQGADGFEAAKGAYNQVVRNQKARAQACVAATDAAFAFLDEAFGASGQEPLIFITKLSADPVMIKLVSEWGGDAFMAHNKSLLFTERGIDLAAQVQDLLQEEV